MSQPPPEPVMQVYVVNGTRTSQGPGPGPMQLPVSEANALIGMRFAVPGTRTSQGPGPGPMQLPVSEANALIGMRFAVPGHQGTERGRSRAHDTAVRWSYPAADTPAALELGRMR